MSDFNNTPTGQSHNNFSAITAADIAGHFNLKPQIDGSFRGCCFVHQGDGVANATVSDRPDGGLLFYCHSRGCSWDDFLAVIRQAFGDVRRSWKYSDGSLARRTDLQQGGKKHSQQGAKDRITPLRMLNDSPENPVLVVEGEHVADAAASALGDAWTVANWRGGSSAVGKANYSALAGRSITVWPDADIPGRKAAAEVVKRAFEAGAKSVSLLPAEGDDGTDAANLNSSEICEFVLTGQQQNNPQFEAYREINFEQWSTSASVSRLIDNAPRPVLGKLLLPGLATLSADAGVGKSTTLMGLAVDWAGDQTHFAGTLEIKTDQRQVLVIDGEQPQWMGAARIRARQHLQGHVNGYDLPQLRGFRAPASWHLGMLESLLDFLHLPRLGLIIADPLATLLGIPENDDVAVAELMSHLSALAHDRGVVLLIATHPSKSARKDARESGSMSAVDSIRGHSRFGDAIDTSLWIRKDPKTALRYLHTEKQRMLEIGTAWRIEAERVEVGDDLEVGAVSYLVDVDAEKSAQSTEKETQTQRLERAIASVIANRPDWTITQLAQAVAVDVYGTEDDKYLRACKYALKQLADSPSRHAELGIAIDRRGQRKVVHFRSAGLPEQMPF